MKKEMYMVPELEVLEVEIQQVIANSDGNQEVEIGGEGDPDAKEEIWGMGPLEW